ncbi:drug/metabolite transporter (DMT)-like permease [Kibdelosporangium banguiense]|uniref:Drug/metabolite transporter (DMT)-like permease n=1 Tax=Kibdelosporangium banguiense TaxID=1365924 RepID=A0ABS4T7A6_9PSEU|nr:DMT family transporter [Kibdelosporangium banguiense]MBP2320166.1 drug/metabolite transporter (DMT)-like permease [Kibdelosporangium banguiense]
MSRADAGQPGWSRTGAGRSWVPAFVLLAMLWGSSFLLIKIAVNAGVAPMWVGLWRCFFGAIALWLLVLLTRQRMPRDLAVWGHGAVVALLLNAIPFPLFAFGETKISSVLAGVWNATVPLMTLMFVLVLLPDERPNARRLAGMATGFVGVLVVLGIWHGVETGPLIGTLACLGATFCYGGAFAYSRRFLTGRPESATALATVQVTCGTLQLALVTPLTADAPQWPGFGATAALVVLGALGTGVAYQLNFIVIRAAGSTVASTVTYITPLFSTALGAVFLAEPVGLNTVAGAGLIILGVLLSRSGPAPGQRPRARQEPGRQQDLDPIAD